MLLLIRQWVSVGSFAELGVLTVSRVLEEPKNMLKNLLILEIG